MIAAGRGDSWEPELKQLKPAITMYVSPPLGGDHNNQGNFNTPIFTFPGISRQTYVHPLAVNGTRQPEKRHKD